MTIESLISQLKNNPQSTSFQEVIAVIDTNYHLRQQLFRTEIKSTRREKTTVLVRFSLSQNYIS